MHTAKSLQRQDPSRHRQPVPTRSTKGEQVGQDRCSSCHSTTLVLGAEGMDKEDQTEGFQLPVQVVHASMNPSQTQIVGSSFTDLFLPDFIWCCTYPLLLCTQIHPPWTLPCTS